MFQRSNLYSKKIIIKLRDSFFAHINLILNKLLFCLLSSVLIEILLMSFLLLLSLLILIKYYLI